MENPPEPLKNRNENPTKPGFAQNNAQQDPQKVPQPQIPAAHGKSVPEPSQKQAQHKNCVRQIGQPLSQGLQEAGYDPQTPSHCPAQQPSARGNGGGCHPNRRLHHPPLRAACS